MLLRTLHEAHDQDEWADLLRREVQSYTADDASLALLALGYRSFTDLREQFAGRLAHVTDRYLRNRPPPLVRSPHPASEAASGPPPAAGSPASLSAGIRAWQDETWHAYRAAYETHLPPAPEEFA
ncbi:MULTISPECIES: hypothetical protein [unclassified Streptomyces]|uniref:hypothetical protein n=1 Tax=unclassified Streptomyces TaxID=2593676 RepID=UPI002035B867|nr:MULTISPECIES: hypothetical protein [unclassified Streptomyces]